MTKYARKNGLKQAETQGKRKYMMNAESQNVCKKTKIKEQEQQYTTIKKLQAQENFLRKNESQNLCRKIEGKEKALQYNTIKKPQEQKKFLQNDESQMI